MQATSRSHRSCAIIASCEPIAKSFINKSPTTSTANISENTRYLRHNVFFKDSRDTPSNCSFTYLGIGGLGLAGNGDGGRGEGVGGDGDSGDGLGGDRLGGSGDGGVGLQGVRFD